MLRVAVGEVFEALELCVTYDEMSCQIRFDFDPYRVTQARLAESLVNMKYVYLAYGQNHEAGHGCGPSCGTILVESTL